MISKYNLSLGRRSGMTHIVDLKYLWMNVFEHLFLEPTIETAYKIKEMNRLLQGEWQKKIMYKNYPPTHTHTEKSWKFGKIFI